MPASFSPQNLHTVSFPKPGFMELKPISFDVGTEITLSFSTKSDKGIILFASGGVQEHPRRKRRQTGEVSQCPPTLPPPQPQQAVLRPPRRHGSCPRAHHVPQPQMFAQKPPDDLAPFNRQTFGSDESSECKRALCRRAFLIRSIDSGIPPDLRSLQTQTERV